MIDIILFLYISLSPKCGGDCWSFFIRWFVPWLIPEWLFCLFSNFMPVANSWNWNSIYMYIIYAVKTQHKQPKTRAKRRKHKHNIKAMPNLCIMAYSMTTYKYKSYLIFKKWSIDIFPHLQSLRKMYVCVCALKKCPHTFCFCRFLRFWSQSYFGNNSFCSIRMCQMWTTCGRHVIIHSCWFHPHSNWGLYTWALPENQPLGRYYTYIRLFFMYM